MHNLNSTIFTFINSRALRYPGLDAFFVVATSYYFSYLIFFAIGTYLAFYLPYKAATPLLRLQRYGQAALTGISILITLYIVKVLKVLVAYPRPYATLVNANLLVGNTTPLESFPSAHTALMMALATSVYFYHKKLGSLLFLLTMIVGLSRIFVGVHYPFDVFGGLIIGFLIPFGLHRAFAERVKKG